MSMRTLEQMAHDDAEATLREADEIREHRPLSFEEASMVANAVGVLHELGQDKAERVARYTRRKAQSRNNALRRGCRS